MNRHELLAPAGDIESAYAAIHYGADAIYLGLRKFSARAEALNFSPTELDEITAFAHAAEPRRKVFVAINTLVLNSELPDLVEHLGIAAEIGADAVIVQDLGVACVARKYFPGLPLHASTQLAVHNLPGARALGNLGFRRVTLARELTISEIAQIAAESGIEVEVFLHGALCYSYSGLCLYSSLLRSGSGNRGRCSYPCRDAFGEKNTAPKRFPFSMKDMALPDEVNALKEAGVTSFKIEGRKKSPLYVAATTAFYRKALNGNLTAAERKQHEADIRTVFSRPWTNLFTRSEDNWETTDPETVGHRGAPVGRILEVLNAGSRSPGIQFRPQRPIERHDGLQVDLPGKPFGFPIDTLLLMPDSGKGRGKPVFEAPAGALVQVLLPPDHPELPRGATIYASSSQAVKRTYKFPRPKPGEFRIRRKIAVDVSLSATAITARATSGQAVASSTLNGNFERSRNLNSTETAVKTAFEKLGDTPFLLDTLAIHNPDSLFVPVSLLNRLRREVLASLRIELNSLNKMAIEATIRSIMPESAPSVSPVALADADWVIKTDTLSNLSGFRAADWATTSEVVIEIGNEPLDVLRDGLERLGQEAGKERIRLALPSITRARDEKRICRAIKVLAAGGWTKWEAANISALQYLKPNDIRPDLSADWQLYVLNRMAAVELGQMSAARFTLSPEDGRDNMSSLLGEFRGRATVLIYQDTPLFISETCGFANIAGKCQRRTNCARSGLPLVSAKKENLLLITRGCRTILLSELPFSLSGRLDELAQAGACRFRADFMYRPYSPDRVKQIWSLLRNNRPVPATHQANYHRAASLS